VLQQREVIPVGSTEPVSVDVRLIAATNRNLERDIEEGRFRRDLYYRLNVILLDLPPLRERQEDISLLADYFLSKQAGEDEPKKLSPKALQILQEYLWPGNVRELENVIERAVVLTPGSSIKPDALPTRLREKPAEPLVQDRPAPNPSLEIIERAYIEHVLNAEGGNKTKAAEVLGIDPSTLYRKIKRYDLDE
jgi:two-component system response regulator HydG